MEKVINGKVEKIEFSEAEKSNKSASKKRNSIISNKSPVKISREHCSRGSFVSIWHSN